MKPRLDRSGVARGSGPTGTGAGPSPATRPRAITRAGRLLGLVVALGVGAGCPSSDAPPDLTPASVVPSGDLVAAAHPTPDRILVASADGEIHRSDDGGETWLRARVPANDGLADLAMADPEHGWAVGPGVALRTLDGGAVWERQRLPGRAADHALVAVDGPDPGRAIALRADGAALRWRDDGRGWRLGRDGAGRDDGTDAGGGRARPRAVSCVGPAQPACVIAGESVLATAFAAPESGGGAADEDDGRSPIAIRPPVELAPFAFRLGRVELSATDRSRLIEAAAAVAGRAIDWRVEAFVSAAEIERYADMRDPSALFERIEARAQELRSTLEAAGVDGERVQVVGEPPWEYEERIDDDPGLVARYVEARRAERPSAVVRAVERFDLRAVALAADGRLVAAGAGPHVLWRRARDAALRRAASPTAHAVLALAWVRDGMVLAGRQGVIRRLDFRVDGEDEALTPGFVAIDGPAFFEPIRALAADPSGERVVAVGDAGRVLLSRDGGAHWQGIATSAQADRPRFR